MQFLSDIRRLIVAVFAERRARMIGGGVFAVAFIVFAVAWFAPDAVPVPDPDEAGRTPGAEVPRDAEVAVDPVEAAPDTDDDVDVADSGLPPLPDGDPLAYPPIVDGVPRLERPAAVRGLYLNAWAAGSPRRLGQLIETANATEINAFVIDVKEGGEISYASGIPLVRHVGADRRYIGDVRGMLRRLRENGIYAIARIVVFRDEVLAQARPDWAVQNEDGTPWQDAHGKPWVDSYNRDVWDYNIAIAREALELGFSEVQWDYVRFPDVPRALRATARWPAQEGRSMQDAIREFLLYSREALSEYGAPVSADVFGLTVSVANDLGIGQRWEKMLDATDVLLPMVYPSHFARGTYGIPVPNAYPRATVLRAMQDAVRRSAGVDGAATIRPWLQDFTLGSPRYGPAHVRAQIEAVYEAGLEEWVLWNPGSRYTEAALATADGVEPRFPDPDGEGVAPDTTAADTAGLSRPLGTPVRPDTTGTR